MKILALLLAVISFSAVSTFAAEPLLLEPLSPSILSTMPTTSALPATTTTGANGVQVTVGKEGVEANFATTSQMNSNMVPQNAAAKGQPLPEKRNPRVKVQTKQGTQGNTQWNAGGRGHKTFF